MLRQPCPRYSSRQVPTPERARRPAAMPASTAGRPAAGAVGENVAFGRLASTRARSRLLRPIRFAAPALGPCPMQRRAVTVQSRTQLRRLRTGSRREKAEHVHHSVGLHRRQIFREARGVRVRAAFQQRPLDAVAQRVVPVLLQWTADLPLREVVQRAWRNPPYSKSISTAQVADFSRPSRIRNRCASPTASMDSTTFRWLYAIELSAQSR